MNNDKPWIVDGAIVRENVTPTEYLIIESLIARHRLGEHEWSYPGTLISTLRKMEAKGILTWRSHVMQGWVYARASDLLLSTLKPYKPPIIRDMLGEYGEDDPPWSEYGALAAIILAVREDSAANGEDWWKDPATLADRIMKTGRVIVLPTIVRNTK